MVHLLLKIAVLSVITQICWSRLEHWKKYKFGGKNGDENDCSEKLREKAVSLRRYAGEVELYDEILLKIFHFQLIHYCKDYRPPCLSDQRQTHSPFLQFWFSTHLFRYYLPHCLMTNRTQCSCSLKILSSLYFVSLESLSQKLQS